MWLAVCDFGREYRFFAVKTKWYLSPLINNLLNMEEQQKAKSLIMRKKLNSITQFLTN